MDKTYIASIIAALQEIRQRPFMWIGRSENIVPFINGFNTACFATVYKYDRDKLYEEVVRERGWHVSSQGPEFFMREKGLSENQIVDELLAIQIELWKRRLLKLADHEEITLDDALWDKQFAKSQDALAKLADQALTDYDEGRTQELDPDNL